MSHPHPHPLPPQRPSPLAKNQYELLHNFRLDVTPAFEAILSGLVAILEKSMTEQELKAYGDAKAQEVIDAITTAVKAEHDEILASVAAKTGLSDEQVKAAFDASTELLKGRVADLIGGVFTPDVVPVPADGGTPPVPAPAP